MLVRFIVIDQKSFHPSFEIVFFQGFDGCFFMLATESFFQFLSLGNEQIFGQASVFFDNAIDSCLGIDVNFNAVGFFHLVPESFGNCALANGSTFVFNKNGLIGFKR